MILSDSFMIFFIHPTHLDLDREPNIYKGCLGCRLYLVMFHLNSHVLTIEQNSKVNFQLNSLNSC